MIDILRKRLERYSEPTPLAAFGLTALHYGFMTHNLTVAKKENQLLLTAITYRP